MSLRSRVAILCALLAPFTVAARAAPTFDLPGRSGAHPSIAAAGAFVAVAWGGMAEGAADVYLAVSRDGGTSFGAPVRVNRTPGEARLGGEMPPRVALAASGGSPQPDIVVLWTSRGERTAIKSARSRDGGRTFDAEIVLQAADAGGDRGWPALAVDRRGVAHALWLDHRGLAAQKAAPARAAQDHSGHDGVAMAQRSGLYYTAIADGRQVERELTKGVCYCCKTALASGADGALWAAWRHVYPGNLRDVAVSVSRDGGASFSAPARVSEDKWAINGCPDDGPALAVDTAGVAHIVWPTVIGGDEPEGAIFYSSSRDGRHFTPRVRVPTLGKGKPSHPQIVIDAHDRVAIAWDENVDGKRVAVIKRTMQSRAGAPTFGDATLLATEGPALYPVMAATDRGLLAVWTTGGTAPRIAARIVSNE